MSVSSLKLLFDGAAFLEGPRWHEGKWWTSDQHAGVVLAVDHDGIAEEVAVVDSPSGLGWLPDGDLLIASMADQCLLRRDAATGKVSVHADLSHVAVANVNDMIVDSLGRAYVGCIGFDDQSFESQVELAPLIRVDPDGSVTVVAEGLLCPNGIVLLDDERTLVVAESLGGSLTAFSVEKDGSLTDRRPWVQIGPRPARATLGDMLPALEFIPDGCAAAPDGTIWCSDLKGQRCVRIGADGSILDEVRTPDNALVFACAIGGSDGNTLLLCAAPDWIRSARIAERVGKLYTCQLDG